METGIRDGDEKQQVACPDADIHQCMPATFFHRLLPCFELQGS